MQGEYWSARSRPSSAILASYLAANWTLRRRLVRDANFLTKRGQMRSRRLSLFRKTWLLAALFLSLPSAAVRAQTSMTAFLPEVNSNFRLSANVRLVFDTKGYLEDGELNRAQIGPSLQLNIRP